MYFLSMMKSRCPNMHWDQEQQPNGIKQEWLRTEQDGREANNNDLMQVQGHYTHKRRKALGLLYLFSLSLKVASMNGAIGRRGIAVS